MLCLLVRLLYALYALLTFLVMGSAALVLVLVLPGLQQRRGVVRAASRVFLRLAGMPLTVTGLQHLPAGQCVIVANHASYLDGPIFTAALPPRFSFVIKREMARVPLAGFLLQRIGSAFVDRFKAGKTTADARRVLRSAQDGQSLFFFPEGTFSPEPGLLRFHAGAFITAVRAGCPIVPAVVRGSREALSPAGVLPRPARLHVEFLPLLALPEAAGGAAGEAAGADAASRLSEQARNAILARLCEPDLAAA